MKRISTVAWIIAALLPVAVPALSAPIAIDTSAWSSTYAPSIRDSNGNDYWSQNDNWTGLHAGTPSRTANSSGSLISDFALNGDFTFSGSLRPIYANNIGCTGSNDNSCNDNDIVGLVFGWQDQNNHYRLGWSQGGVSDITGRTGLYLVREVGGTSTTLASWQDLFWQDETVYDFTISRLGDQISFALSGPVARDQAGSQDANSNEGAPQLSNWGGIDYSLPDATFLNGRIGVYTESQTAVFSKLNVEGTAAVPVPATLGLIALGLILLGFLQPDRNTALNP